MAWRSINAEQARASGLVVDVVAGDRLLPAALEITAVKLATPRRAAAASKLALAAIVAFDPSTSL